MQVSEDDNMQVEQQKFGFEFTGTGSEYFKIWIVNLLLSIVTLGIYSAWAKVRRMQYFYRNTRLAGSSFDYHGTPKAILKGRVIAFSLLAIYSAAGELNPILGAALGLLIATIMPWLIVRSLRFKLYNSSYRGLRFGFAGSDRQAYRVFLLYPLLTGLTLFMLAPFTHQRIKQFQHQNSRFGNTSFNFDATVKSFYAIYFQILGIVVALSILTAIMFKNELSWMMALLPFAFLAAFLVATSYLAVALPNLIWNSTCLGNHRFHSRLEVLPYLWISFSNLLGIGLTLGLFIPFATIRMMRYKLEHMSMTTHGDWAEFVADQQQFISATGEETAEMFDVDISL